MFQYAWKTIIIYGMISALVYMVYKFPWGKGIAIPFLPVGLIGTAVAFYIGFKNNSSYDRLWEARKVWDNIITNSRNWAIMVLSYVDGNNPGNTIDAADTANTDGIKMEKGPAAIKSIPSAIQKELIYRQIAFANALRCQLRAKTVWEENNKTSHKLASRVGNAFPPVLKEELQPFLSEEETSFLESTGNPAMHILEKQSQRLKELCKLGLIDDFKDVTMVQLIADNCRQQGACERIKSFPFPRQYAYFSSVFVWIFIISLPFGLLGEFAKAGENHVWLMIPANMLISWIFMVMEQIGNDSENPFENAINDIPMTAICREIEIDLKEMLGEKDLPSKLEAVDNILL
jgi:putative membrane protein